MENIMYSDLKNVQILIALLKEYNIHRIVLSPGGRNVPFVHSVENDPDFTCYSIVDERSAGFFALGIIQKTHEPVAICCTSATAVCNYMSAVNEAFYQKLPLVVLTADRNGYYLNQNEDQMIPQTAIFRDVCKKEVSLPIVKDELDEWYCGRLVNEALSELVHHSVGPVHINFLIEKVGAGYNTPSLPPVNKIERIMKKNLEAWKTAQEQLYGKKILLIYGQHLSKQSNIEELLNKFALQYNCVIAADYLSNIHCEKQFNTFLISNTNAFESLNEILPDIVITMGENYVSEIRNWLKRNIGKFVHWRVNEDGEFADQFHNLKYVFECTDEEFIDKLLPVNEGIQDTNTYYEQWLLLQRKIEFSNLPYSSMYITKRYFEKIPKCSNLHLANSNSVRLAQMFPLDSSISVFCNRGTNGIDGSMSSFMGLAAVSDELSFLLIGDLSFFYDMNALWNRYVGSNIRILLMNNSGASIFHVSPGEKLLPTIDRFTAAEHDAKAESWVKSRGMKYLTASTIEEFEKNIDVFTDTNAKIPMLFEVFTDKAEDADLMKKFYSDNKTNNLLSGDKKVLLKTAFRKLIK